MISLYTAIVLSILAPILLGFANTLDKFVVSKKVKHALGFIALVGLVFLFFGIIFSLFSSWKGISLVDIWPVAISGIILGILYFFYYRILEKSDASNFLGLLYLYPILVALFSFFFLKEILSPLAYVGLAMSISGALMLSLRIRRMHGGQILALIFLLILGTAIYEFLIKVSTINLPEMNAIALEFVFIGLTISLSLFIKKIRLKAKLEIKNLKYAFLSEILSIISISFTFFAMSRLSATIDTAIATLQPLSILVFERTLGGLFGKIHKDKLTLIRLVSISLTLGGVIILAVTAK